MFLLSLTHSHVFVCFFSSHVHPALCLLPLVTVCAILVFKLFAMKMAILGSPSSVSVDVKQLRTWASVILSSRILFSRVPLHPCSILSPGRRPWQCWRSSTPCTHRRWRRSLPPARQPVGTSTALLSISICLPLHRRTGSYLPSAGGKGRRRTKLKLLSSIPVVKMRMRTRTRKVWTRTWRKVKFWRRFSSSSELRVRVDRLLVTLRRRHTHDTHKILTLFCVCTFYGVVRVVLCWTVCSWWTLQVGC